MATDAHTRAAPTRAPSFPQFVPLEDAKIALSNIGGTLSLLVGYLEEHADKLGTVPIPPGIGVRLPAAPDMSPPWGKAGPATNPLESRDGPLPNIAIARSP